MDSAMATGPPHTVGERGYGCRLRSGEPTRDMKKVRPLLGGAPVKTGGWNGAQRIALSHCSLVAFSASKAAFFFGSVSAAIFSSNSAS